MSSASSASSNGGYLVSSDGAALPLTAVHVDAKARGGLARVAVRQCFRNPHAEPLSVTYSFPLPADAAVSGFSFRIGDKTVVGEIERRAVARERFEHAILEGKTAALVDEERSSLFTQNIGNIPPGAEITAELILDQRLVWNEEGSWEWRFPLALSPRYLGGAGRVADAGVITQVMAKELPALGATLALHIQDALHGQEPESPSHRIEVARGMGDGSDGAIISFPRENRAPLDRDMVVRWRVATPNVGCTLTIGRTAGDDHGFGLLTLVPPLRGDVAAIARDLVVLLDTSGSMAGAPLEQAKRVTAALLQTLTERDQLEMIEFSTKPRHWQRGAVAMSAGAKRDALQWLSGLRASGGTEMHEGIREALFPLRQESQRQVVLVTDGQIGFESEIVREILESLPAGSRVHTVGIGSSVNRSLTGPAARAGRGAEIVIGLDEDPERAAQRLVARTDAPIVVNVEIVGSALVQCAPEKIPDLFANAPVLVGLRLAPAGGSLVVRGQTATGLWQTCLDVRAAAPELGHREIRTLFGRELVEDLEMQAAAAPTDTSLNEAIESAGLQFGIATRLTSWVAMTEEATVDPRAPMRRERIPQQVPYGMSVEGLGLRAATPHFAAPAAPMGFAPVASAPPLPAPKERLSSVVARRSMPMGAPRPSPARPRMASPPRSSESPPRTLRGAVVARLPEALVVEVAIEGSALAWELPEEILVLYPPGNTDLITTRCHLPHTTKAGLVQPGMSLRVAVLLPSSETRTPRQILLRVNGQDLTITL